MFYRYAPLGTALSDRLHRAMDAFGNFRVWNPAE